MINLRLIVCILLCTAASQAGTILLHGFGTFPGDTPDTPYTQAGAGFVFNIILDSDPVPLDVFPPDATLINVGPWTYTLAGNTVASGVDGIAFLYLDSRGGLFDLCVDIDCNLSIGLAGDPLISSIDAPSIGVGVYAGTDFAYFDGTDFNTYPADSTVIVTAIPEISTSLSFGIGLLGLFGCYLYRGGLRRQMNRQPPMTSPTASTNSALPLAWQVDGIVLRIADP